MDTNPNKDQTENQVEADSAFLEEAERLIWMLLDDQIETADLRQLENLLKESELVRQRYVACVQMHVDLQHHFRPQSESTTDVTDKPVSPVLGSLGDFPFPTDVTPPVSE